MTSHAPAPALSPQAEHRDEVFRRLVESVRDYAIFLLTPDGRIASWNIGAQRLKGYSAEEAIGRHFSMFYPADAIERGWPAEELRLAAANGQLEDEGWRLRKDGSRFWANVVITALRSPEGELIGYGKVTRDLTERREHEERLRESERSLRLLIDGVQDYAIFRLDPHGIVSSWNQGAQRIKGYAAHEIIGKHFSTFYPPEPVARGWPQEELRLATERGHFEDEGWRVRKDGSYFWANVVITAIRDEQGRLLGFSKVTRDLTERRRHEQELRESEENLRLVVEGAKDYAMFLVGPSGVVRSWNAAAQRLLGYSDQDILGRPLATLYTVEEQSGGRPQVELRSAAHAGSYEVEGWRLKADGSRLWVHAALNALTDPEGKLRGYVQIIRDLSDRLRLKELESEGRRLQQFIAMLSHELRNPLAPIANAVQLLKRAPGNAHQVSWCADMIERQSEHLKRLVDDLLDVSRVTSGKIRIEPAVLELNTLVKLACDSARMGVERAGHTLELKPAPQSIFVEGDSTRLTQVVSNLLSNATKYTPAGGRIEVCVERDHRVARILVTDSGIGMSEALLQRAFEPFVQGERSLDRAAGGLGIGLTLVKTVVELHGGSVVAASGGAGKGTRFTVTLPLAAASPNSLGAPATTTQPAPRPSAARLLVVDDNQDAATSLAELLRFGGHPVDVAYDGPQALQMIREQQPDVVFLDLGLPGMDGLEVARLVHADPALAGVRLVALTGYGQAGDREATEAAGFVAHLVKPVEIAQLTQVLDEALNRQRPPRAGRG
jgi:PAS domain S-box-containing protein